MSDLYQVSLSMDVRGRWCLGSPHNARGEALNSYRFVMGKAVAVEEPLWVSIFAPGLPLATDLASSSMPVVTMAVAEAVVAVAGADLQVIPVRIPGFAEPYAILNVTRLLDAVDEERSSVLHWTEADNRPDKMGQYRMVTNLTIDRKRVGNEATFRLQRYSIVWIVNEAVRHALAQGHPGGLHFDPV